MGNAQRCPRGAPSASTAHGSDVQRLVGGAQASWFGADGAAHSRPWRAPMVATAPSVDALVSGLTGRRISHSIEQTVATDQEIGRAHV